MPKMEEKSKALKLQTSIIRITVAKKKIPDAIQIHVLR